MTDLFHGQGALTGEELKEFIRTYEQFGKHNLVTDVHLGDEVSPQIERIVNDVNTMGNLSDRLALTIIQLAKRKLSKHSGDCDVYASLVNNRPEDGICTCGYGMQIMSETGDKKELYSKELKDKLIGVSTIIV